MTVLRSGSPPRDCMTATGVVVAVAPGSIEVEFATPVGCASCRGTCMWRRMPETSRATFATPLQLERGDTVSLSLPERFVLAAAALVYGLPLLGLLIGASIGVAMTGSDVGGVGGAAIGIAAALLTVPGLRRRLEADTVKHLNLGRAEPRGDTDPL
jgi:sigma-E factor negative regulatory protein RseC